MATLTEYFDTEARDFLVQLERAVNSGPVPDAAELHRAARGLRGTAQMAREDRVFRAVSALEAVTRAVSANIVSWSDDISTRARDSIADLRALVEREEDEAQLDARVDTSVDRWRSVGVALPAHLDSGEAAPADSATTGEFREFAAREVAAVADALDKGVQQLAADPMDREPLKMVLRRQRALLGAARLDDIPVVAEVLRAIEDLTRVIAKLDVGVKQEWLDIYRVAREALKGTIDALRRDEDPPASHALSRLRHMREELMERYGAGDPAAAAHPDAGFGASGQSAMAQTTGTQPAQAAAPADMAPAAVTAADEAAGDDVAGHAAADSAAPDVLGAAAGAMQRAVGAAAAAVVTAAADTVQAVAGTIPPDASAQPGTGAAADSDVVSVDDLCYRGNDALERALELRDTIMRAAADDADARAAADELFDLIRLAQS